MKKGKGGTIVAWRAESCAESGSRPRSSTFLRKPFKSNVETERNSKHPLPGQLSSPTPSRPLHGARCLLQRGGFSFQDQTDTGDSWRGRQLQSAPAASPASGPHAQVVRRHINACAEGVYKKPRTSEFIQSNPGYVTDLVC